MPKGNKFSKRDTTCQKIVILHANVQSIHNKYQEIEHLLHDCKCDVLCLSETWGKDHKVQAMNIENFELASYYNRKLFEHGGTAIFVRNSLDYKIRNDINKISFEMNFELTAIELKPSKIVVVAVYRPDKDLPLFFDLLTKLLQSLCREEKQFIITGDFNLNVLKLDNKIKKWLRILNNYNCKLVLNEPTRIQGTSATCIDNFIINFDLYEGLVLNRKLSDHNVIKLVIDYYLKDTCNKPLIFSRIMSQNNFNYFSFLIRQDYVALKNQLIKCDDSNTKMNILQNAIKFYYDIAFPKKKIRVCNVTKRWTSEGIEISKTNLEKMETMYAFQPTEQRKLQIRLYRKVLRKVFITAKKLQFKNRIQLSKNKVKESWKIINEQVKNHKQQIKNKQKSIETIKGEDGQEETESLKIANMFNNYFLNIAHKITSKNKIGPDKCMRYLNMNIKPATTIRFETVDYKELWTTVSNMKQKMTMDINDMNTKTLRQLILGNEHLFELLYIVINDCLDKGIFPDSLKCGRVIPLHKKGDCLELGNYRPVCILPTISKILESLIKKRIVNYFEENNLFTVSQYGFRKGRSTEMAIRKVIYYILESLDSSQKCASIYCDLSKAFDCLRHDILLLKLRYYGFEGTELNLMRTYLQNRSQVVSLNGVDSVVGAIDIGVPQGSILGPVLFLIYVNDLVSSLPSWTYTSLFADDTHVGVRDKCNNELDIKIKKVLDTLKEWFNNNGIILNADKSVIMQYQTRKSAQRQYYAKETVFLGYTVDYTISHAAHIEKLCKNMASANYALFRLKPLLDEKSLISVYYAYIQSLARYAITVWGNASDVGKVLKMQKRAIRTIFGLRKRTSAKEYFKKNEIMTVISLYIYNSLVEIHEEKDNLIKKKQVHTYHLRNKEKLVNSKVRLDKVQKQGMYTKIAMYNKLPLCITDLHVIDFKRTLKQFFESNPFYSLNEFMQMRLVKSSFLDE